MFMQGGGNDKSATEEDELYDYDYSVDLAPAGGGGQFGSYIGGAGGGYGMASKAPPSAVAKGRMMTGQAGRVPGSSLGGRMMTGQAGGPLASRRGAPPGTAAGGGGPGDVRPMTSVQGAGYQSAKPSRSFDPLGQGKGAAPALAEKTDNGAEDLARDMEKQVNRLIEASADAAVKNDFAGALEQAKEAGKRERALCKHRGSNGLAEQINIDLTYAVCFNLANAYHNNKMYEEALHTYSLLVKNKQYPQSGRLRVNMGNIHYELKKFPQAIKMYRMALDQIPNTGKEIRFKIFRNIGNAFVRLGQFQDAIQSYQTIMRGSPDFQTGFNLILCYYALGDADTMKKGFAKLLSIPIAGMMEEEEEPAEAAAKEDADAVAGARPDGLRQEMKRRQKEANQYILTAARLITPVLDKADWVAGYRWAIDTLKPDHEELASELEIEMAVMYLKKKAFSEAIEVLKSFEKKDPQHKAMAATNLSFVYFLEADYNQAEKHADTAYNNDRYNAKALVNKGNCLMMRGELDMAQRFFLEAIGVEADCVEAIFNLGLVNIQLGNPQEATLAFEKLHRIIPHSPEVIYHLANLCDQSGDSREALKWFNILSTRVPSDPGILHRMGQIYNKANDESQAFHYHLESYRHYPVSLDVVSWLGVWYVKMELYEKAIHFFERASQIQPNEVKWRLMVTSCYRRMHNYPKALELYEQIHAEHPENMECLRYLVAICKDSGRPFETYQQKLQRLERSAAQSTTQMGRGALTRVGGSGAGGDPNVDPRQARGGGGGALGRVVEEDSRKAPAKPAPMHAPMARVMDGPGSAKSRSSGTSIEDEDGFGDTDVGELLP